MAEQRVSLDLGDGVRMVVVAEQVGPALVGESKIVARLAGVTEPIERVGRNALEAAKRASPSKATVELGFGVAIEQGELVALFGKGRGEASIKVVLEWTAPPKAQDGSG
jgi:hypothetical protein